ncbi:MULTISPECIES: intermembrane phospholipid transport protein YdbH family protein [unclassified Brevundimonas]|uniref:intermembrane phospholipid transport protein YdbH family protein n=1 Tax=unclassified Brevundimonas TaxID=2622653 RepID=UPI0025C35B25|nr:MULTISPECIES: YdbH domain-containing protein [unclassified Brevundimonas]
MTDELPASPPRRVRRSVARTVLIAGMIGLLLLIVLATALYLNRRAAARELLVGWLDRKGIDADVEVEHLEIDGFVGKITIGDPRNPDFKVERVEVDYTLGMPWSKTGLGVTPSRIRMVRPLARASWKGGKLSLGSLDPLVAEFTARPPRPDSRAPLIIVEQVRARIDTEYGPLQVLADARIDNSRLLQLKARLPAASLKSGEVEARGLSATVDLTTSGDRVAVKIDAAADRFAMAGAGGAAAKLNLTGNLPYPDLKARRGDGRAVIAARLTANSLSAAGLESRQAEATLDFDGVTEGWIETFRVVGKGKTRLRARDLTGQGMKARNADLSLDRADILVKRDQRGLEWRVASPASIHLDSGTAAGATLTRAVLTSGGLTAGGRDAAFEVQAPLAVSAASLASGDLTLNQTRGRLEFDMVRDGVTRMTATGALSAARASWSGLGAPAKDDLPELAELKRALSAFAVDAPGIELSAGSAGTALVVTRPVTARPSNGGVLTLTPARTPLFLAEPGRPGGGALSLTAQRGGGLPEARILVPSWSLTPGGFRATLEGEAALDFGPARNLTLTTRGDLASHAGRLTYTAKDCIPLSIERLELGENDVTQATGRLCPSDAPLITVADGGWRAQGRLADVAATAPFLAMRFSEAQGRLVVDGKPTGLAMTATIASAQVSDTTDPQRFLPLTATGEAKLTDEVWSGGFDLTRLDHAIGRIDLRHDGKAQAGGVTISAPNLAFTQYGLQPDDLSPLAADYLKSPVEGSVGFEGRFDWTPTASTSSGVASIPELDFTSPAGKVQGLKGRVEFTSLTPLITAPDQHLTVDRLETFTPLTGLDLRFGLDETSLDLTGGAIQAAGGRISIEPFKIPLKPGESWGGVILVEQVQLNELMKSANLQDKAQLDSVVSGRLPFTYAPDVGWRISGGVLNAVRPGRLSIKPEVFDDLAAGGGVADGAALPPNTMQDLAYQAMQDLAISGLSAEVNSLDGGRLGVRFHINGRHDPPEREQLRLSWMELIRRDFLNKKLNLPSDTPIDLTLDTTWNANQIVSDLLEYARRGETPAISP